METTIKFGTHTLTGNALTTPYNLSKPYVFINDPHSYQEVISNPDYCDKILVFTCPEIGTMGVNLVNLESSMPQCAAVIVNQVATHSSHYLDKMSLESWLNKHHIPLISDIDVRYLVKNIKEADVITLEGKQKESVDDHGSRYRILGSKKRLAILGTIPQNIINTLTHYQFHLEFLNDGVNLEAIEESYPDGLILSQTYPLEFIETLQKLYPMLLIKDSFYIPFNDKGSHYHQVVYPNNLKMNALSYKGGTTIDTPWLDLEHDLVTNKTLVYKHSLYPTYGIEYQSDNHPYLLMFLEKLQETL